MDMFEVTPSAVFAHLSSQDKHGQDDVGSPSAQSFLGELDAQKRGQKMHEAMFRMFYTNAALHNWPLSTLREGIERYTLYREAAMSFPLNERICLTARADILAISRDEKRARILDFKFHFKTLPKDLHNNLFQTIQADFYTICLWNAYQEAEGWQADIAFAHMLVREETPVLLSVTRRQVSRSAFEESLGRIKPLAIHICNVQESAVSAQPQLSEEEMGRVGVEPTRYTSSRRF